MCSQRGIEHSESQLFPEATGNKEGETAAGERHRGEGVDNMFPLLLNAERTNMITGMLARSLRDDWVTGMHKKNRA